MTDLCIDSCLLLLLLMTFFSINVNSSVVTYANLVVTDVPYPRCVSD